MAEAAERLRARPKPGDWSVLESYELTFRLIAGHDRNHLVQARRTLDAVR